MGSRGFMSGEVLNTNASLFNNSLGPNAKFASALVNFYRQSSNILSYTPRGGGGVRSPCIKIGYSVVPGDRGLSHV